MKTQFLHKNDNKNLILFFSDFASHPSHFSHLKASKYDVLMCYSYCDLEDDFKFDLTLIKNYENIILIAWSMGVAVASKALGDHVFLKNIAINGTSFGIHENLGIEPKLYEKTLTNLQLEKFKKATFGDKINLSKDFIFENEDVLKEELQNLYSFTTKN